MASSAIFTKTPSSQRLEPGSFNIQACPWPAGTTDESADAAAIAGKIVDAVNNTLASQDLKALSELFVQDGYWRDHLALSWSLRTLKGRDKILEFLIDRGQPCPLTKVEVDASTDFTKPQLTALAPSGGSKGINFFIKFTTQHGSGRGVVRLVEVGGEWKIWTFYTALGEINGHKEPVGANRPDGVKHGATPGRKNWLDRRRDEENFVGSEPDVLIIGAFLTRPDGSCSSFELGLTCHTQEPDKAASQRRLV